MWFTWAYIIRIRPSSDYILVHVNMVTELPYSVIILQHKCSFFSPLQFWSNWSRAERLTRLCKSFTLFSEWRTESSEWWEQHWCHYITVSSLVAAFRVKGGEVSFLGKLFSPVWVLCGFGAGLAVWERFEGFGKPVWIKMELFLQLYLVLLVELKWLAAALCVLAWWLFVFIREPQLLPFLCGECGQPRWVTNEWQMRRDTSSLSCVHQSSCCSPYYLIFA